MQQRNKFEMKAHNAQFRKPRPSWTHTIETYTGKGKTDWFLIAGVAFLIGFGLVALSIIY